jgi:hypothetical protein
VRLELIADNRLETDRILVAQLTGTARHHARWRELTEAEESAAAAELRELDEPLGRQAAELCRRAGADPGGDPRVGRGRTATPRRGQAAAFSGGLRPRE